MSAVNSTAHLMTGFSSQCFPVRSLTNYKRVDEGGAWLVAYRAEQRRRFKAVLCNDPVSSESVQPPQRQHKKPSSPDILEEPTRPKKLDGFYLMKKFYLEDPADLCSVKISGQELRNVSEDDFLLFDNVVHVDAGDNNLPFVSFKNFISLRELEIPLNNISGSIRLESHDFGHLEKLDLSYNRITGTDILALGLLRNLRTLHLTGNEIRKLPLEMARTYRTITGITASGTVESQDRRVRFNQLENLYLDHNELTDTSTFASLAGLKKLKYLNLEHNEITSIPHLRLLGARLRHGEDLSTDLGTSKDATPHPIEVPSPQQEGEAATAEQEDAEEEEGVDDKESEVMDEVDEILSRTLPGNEKEEPEQQSHEKVELRPHSSSLTEDASLLGDKYQPPLPFPHLLHLNLANNMIFEEEGLLATMGWPHLRELVIWGNPLTTAFKGDPPILSMKLGHMKGVRIFRQKPVKRPKPAVDMATNASTRRVQELLPPMPRKRNLLMLEGPPKAEPIAYVWPRPRPLPPISAPTGQVSYRDTVTPRNLSTAPEQTYTRGTRTDTRSKSVPPATHVSPEHPPQRVVEGIRTTAEASPEGITGGAGMRQHQQAGRSESRTDPYPGQEEADTAPGSQKGSGMRQSEEGFFMTQVDEPEVQQDEPMERPKGRRKQKSKRAKHEHPDRPFSVESKYKGYEDLLDVDETDPDIVIPKDIQGNVRSLQYALAHPLIFTESQGNYKETPHKKRGEERAKPSRQNKVEQLGEILDKMRMENKTVESNLENVLKESSKNSRLRKQFPKAKTLLNEVQQKYNEVRVASLKSNAVARDIVKQATMATENKKSGDLDSLDPDFLEEEKELLHELKNFKDRIDTRI